MMQLIGLMVGGYIIVRMVQILATKSESQVTQIFAVICLLATLFLMLGMLATGATVPKF